MLHADLLPLIGALPEIGGVYVLGGDSEAGITHGPAFGRALAELISGDDPFVSLERFRPERFGGQFTTAQGVAEEIARAEGGVFH